MPGEHSVRPRVLLTSLCSTKAVCQTGTHLQLNASSPFSILHEHHPVGASCYGDEVIDLQNTCMADDVSRGLRRGRQWLSDAHYRSLQSSERCPVGWVATEMSQPPCEHLHGGNLMSAWGCLGQSLGQLA